MKKPLLVDPELYDLDSPVATIEDIRKFNRQRFEFEFLTAILYDDPIENCCVGLCDTTDKDCWVRGHLPGFPLMPGVLMCEAAAQLASYFATKHKLIEGVLGLAGMDDIRVRGKVIPGDRLVVQVKRLYNRKKLIACEFIETVNDDIVCQGIIKGFSLNIE